MRAAMAEESRPPERNIPRGTSLMRRMQTVCSRRSRHSEIQEESLRVSGWGSGMSQYWRSEEHTSELQSLRHLVCRLLVGKKSRKSSRPRFGRGTKPNPITWAHFYLIFFAVVFFFNDTATAEIYTLSLHDALPICRNNLVGIHIVSRQWRHPAFEIRSEEHTSELQSLRHLVCRLLLEKKEKVRAAADGQSHGITQGHNALSQVTI